MLLRVTAKYTRLTHTHTLSQDIHPWPWAVCQLQFARIGGLTKAAAAKATLKLMPKNDIKRIARRQCETLRHCHSAVRFNSQSRLKFMKNYVKGQHNSSNNYKKQTANTNNTYDHTLAVAIWP